MTGQTLNGTVNGHRPPRVPVLGDWQPIHLGGIDAANDQPEPQPATTPAETAPMPEPDFSAVALAKAEAIRTRAAAEAEALRIKAEGEAEAEKIRAAEEAEKQRIANERAAMRLEKERADHTVLIAKKGAEAAKYAAEEEKTKKDAGDEAEQEAARLAEQQRSEKWWKWGARGIYLVGLAIAAPVQFLDFWDPKRPFLVSAPALLEGFALVFAAGAAWAVANRRDVMPYRLGIMLGAVIAAGINLRGGLTNPAIGLNAGIIGAIASLGGPLVLMAYEHGIAQRADGIPSWRETRAADKKVAEEKAARDKARADKKAAEAAAAAEKKARDEAAEAEQKRKDSDREKHHPEVWSIADAIRSARGSAVVTEHIWGEAWKLVTGSSSVGITAEIEAASRAAREQMKTASDSGLSQVDSQMSPRAKRDPDAPDGRRNNGGTPPRRMPGDTAPYHPATRALAADAKRRSNAAREDS